MRVLLICSLVSLVISVTPSLLKQNPSADSSPFVDTPLLSVSVEKFATPPAPPKASS